MVLRMISQSGGLELNSNDLIDVGTECLRQLAQGGAFRHDVQRLPCSLHHMHFKW